MFMAAGLIAGALGHDRISGLGGVARALPITVLAFALAGLSLLGLQPSGGYLTKTLLISAADAGGAWWWILVMQAGGLLTAAYLFRVLGHVLFGPTSDSERLPTVANRPARLQELAVLTLALGALLLGLLPPTIFDLIGVGRFGSGIDAGAAVSVAIDGALGWGKLWGDLWPVLIVGLLVLAAVPWPYRSSDTSPLPAAAPSVTGRTAAALGGLLERADGALRQWPVAGLSLLALTLLMGLLLAPVPIGSLLIGH